MESHKQQSKLVPQRGYGKQDIKSHWLLILIICLIIVLFIVGYFIIKSRKKPEAEPEPEKKEEVKRDTTKAAIKPYIPSPKAEKPLSSQSGLSDAPIFNLAALEKNNLIIRIELLNGTKVYGVTNRLTKLVRRAAHGQLDILTVGNTHSEYTYKESLVIDRCGNPEMAKTVAEFFGIKQVITQVNKELLVDVTVVIGLDLLKVYQGSVQWVQVVN